MSRHFPTWQEATAGCLWIIAATGLAWSGPKLPLLESVILWTVLLLGVTIVLRRFWSWLFGPLFFYDLVRTARRNRLIPARCSFAIAMLAVVFFFYLDWFHLPLTSWEQLFSTPSVTRNQVASFGSTMFSWFFGMQYVAVILLTPAYTAGTIAEEKERRTLDCWFFCLPGTVHFKALRHEPQAAPIPKARKVTMKTTRVHGHG